MGEAQTCGEVSEYLAGFHLRPEAPPPNLTRGQDWPTIAAPRVCSPRGSSPQPPAPAESEWPHLLGALLEGSRDDLPLLSAPIGQHVHDGVAVHP